MKICDRCGKSFQTSRQFGGHRACCGGGKIICDKCGKTIESRMFNWHYKTHDKDKMCKKCGKIIFGGIRKIFCSRSCSAQYNNIGVRRHGVSPQYINCIRCGKKVISGNKFCTQKCWIENKYDIYIKKWLVKEVNGNNGDQIQSQVKRWLRERANNKCEGKLDDGSRCNWSRINPFINKIPLAAHHKDGDHKNTSPENLELLCPSCHSLTGTYCGRNVGKGRDSRRKWREKMRA